MQLVRTLRKSCRVAELNSKLQHKCAAVTVGFKQQCIHRTDMCKNKKIFYFFSHSSVCLSLLFRITDTHYTYAKQNRKNLHSCKLVKQQWSHYTLHI